MARVPADLHIHLDNDVTKERVIKILKSAEENGIKAICLLEHNNINFYKRGGILEELLIEGIEKYYTGKIVTGVELNCTIKDAPISKKTGIDYNGYDIHVAFYGFNPKELKKKVDWFSEEVDAVRYYQDVDSLCAGLRKLNLPEPPKTIFRYAEGVKPFKQLYNYIINSPEKDTYTAVLGEYPHPSAFVRNLAYDPHSILYFDRAQSPSIVDVINTGKECAKFQCISYPYHINRKLVTDVADYIDTLEYIPSKTKTKNFNAVEGPYMLNTDEETKEIEELAKARGLFVTAGSDYQPQDKMYYLPPDATEKMWYAPAPGLYVRQLFDGGLGLLTIDEEFLKLLPDVRDYKIYRQATTSEMQSNATEQKAEEPANEPVETYEQVDTPVEETVTPTPNSEVEETPAVMTDVVEQEQEVNPQEPALSEELPKTKEEELPSEEVNEEPVVEAEELPAVEEVNEPAVETPEIEDIEDLAAKPVTLPLNDQSRPVVVDTKEVEEAEVPQEEVSETEEVEEPAEPEVAPAKPVEKKPVKKPAPKAPAKKPAAKPAAPKKAPAKKAAEPKKEEKKVEEKPADDLDDTLSLLEKLTSDIE